MLNIFKKRSILDDLRLTEKQLTRIVDENPNLRGMLVGYAAEHHFRKHLERKLSVESIKDDDHDRSKKGDRRFYYNNKEYKIEVKSIQTNSVRNVNGKLVGKAQVDASDKRRIELPNGSTIKTTCLLRDEFDILAINLYPLTRKWEFAFIRNEDIPQNTYAKYTSYQKRHLLPTSVKVELPLQEPFSKKLKDLLI